MQYHLGLPLTVLAVLGLGCICGVINGLVTTRLRVPSFITTLATMSVARGVASLWSGGYAIPVAFSVGSGVASPMFKSMFGGQVSLLGLNIPVQAFYFVITGAVASSLLHRTGFGRHVYAVGGNERAALLSGVSTDRVKQIVFGLSGLLAGLAALLHVALVNQGSHIDGSGYELNAIAAVGTMMGALMLSILDNILGLRNIPSEYQMILKGFIIVLAVVVQRQRQRSS
jgi:ribose transport system permease protein